VSQLMSHGTRITLSQVHIKSFNEMQTSDPDKIAKRLMHYLRSLCATGTVKNRHASKAHVQETVINIGVIPAVTVHVVNAIGDCPLGPSPGCFDVPEINLL